MEVAILGGIGLAIKFNQSVDKSRAAVIFNHMVDLSASRLGLDRAFGALADPTRRALVRHLAGGEATVSELARPMPMSLQAVSKHIGVLESAGLVVRRRVGRTQRVRLDRAPIEAITAWAAEVDQFWNGALDALQRHVESEDPAAPLAPHTHTTKKESGNGNDNRA